MLTREQLRSLASNSVRWDFSEDEPMNPPHMAGMREQAWEALGQPANDVVIASGLDLLSSDDRNDRVAALRVLGWYLHDAGVADAVLRATADPARRVRKIAVRMVPVAHSGVADRLLEIASDPGEHHRISALAFARVARRDLRPETVEAIRGLLDAESYRRQILLVFLTQSTPAGAGELLEYIVRVGSKPEAVAATRALCGHRIVRSDAGNPFDLREAAIDWLLTPGTRAKTNYARYYWLPPSSG